MLDALRYGLALSVVAIAPGVFLFWFSIHPLIAFWRRLGPRRTLVLHTAAAVLLAVPVVWSRGWLLRIEFGTRPAIVVLGVVVIGCAAWLRLEINRAIPATVLSGVPELAPGESQQLLVITGIYGRIRHPRYVQMTAVFLGYALLCNYLAAYVVFLLSIPWAWSVALLEDRELHDRFGAEFERYAAQVPRFLPSRPRPAPHMTG
ncbi:MAG: methyltransferase [Acidobacteriota bacterium]|jgi:protein-S-isoprenylcysteine O-methyltransferase Ste14